MNQETLLEAYKNSEDELRSQMEAMDYPSLLDRIKAMFVDALIVMVLFMLVANFFESLGNVSPKVKAAFFFIIFGLYDPLMVSFAKGTIGHKMMGIRVMNAINYEKRVLLPLAFLRFLIKGLLGWISFLGILSSSRNRSLHDALSNSIVLYNPRKKERAPRKRP